MNVNETVVNWTNYDIRSVCTYNSKLKGLYCVSSKNAPNLESYSIDKRKRRRRISFPSTLLTLFDISACLPTLFYPTRPFIRKKWISLPFPEDSQNFIDWNCTFIMKTNKGKRLEFIIKHIQEFTHIRSSWNGIEYILQIKTKFRMWNLDLFKLPKHGYS